MKKILISLFLSFPAGLSAGPADDLAADLSGQIESTQTLKLAVLTFPYIDGFESKGSKIVQERMTTALSPHAKFALMERALLHKILEEKKLEMSGLFDEKTIKGLGKMLGVDAVLTGTLIDTGDNDVEINARVIDAESGRVLASGKAAIKKIWKDKIVPKPIFNPTPLPEIREVEIPETGFTIKTEYDDIETLEKYDAVVKFDKSSASPLEKAVKWETFAKTFPKYKEISLKRAKEWKAYDREFKKAEKLKKQKLQAMKKDYQTLRRYLALTIISQKQKGEWAEKFMVNYGWGADNVYKNELKPFIIPLVGGEWVFVPGNSSLGTEDFFAQKYEAKKVKGKPVSRPEGKPWVYITQTKAKDKCESLGPGYHLLTMEEAQTISRNIESNGSNWTGGAVGEGGLWRGHSDAAPDNALAADVTGDPDDEPYFGTGNSSPSIEKRTHQLSAGEYIWDWSGNVWEWLDMTCAPGSGKGYWSNKWPLAWDDEELADYEKQKAGPAGNYTRYQNLGIYWGCDDNGNAVLRGGFWGYGASAGVFAFDAKLAPSNSGGSVGFRCGRKIIWNQESENP